MDLSEVCRREITLLQTTLLEMLPPKCEFPVPGPVVNANEMQLKRVLAQLILNSREGEHLEWPQIFLNKPYRLKELSNAIRCALTSPKRTAE